MDWTKKVGRKQAGRKLGARVVKGRVSPEMGKICHIYMYFFVLS